MKIRPRTGSVVRLAQNETILLVAPSEAVDSAQILGTDLAPERATIAVTAGELDLSEVIYDLLGEFTIEWKQGASTVGRFRVEVVGSYYFGIDDLKLYDVHVDGFNDAGSYSDEAVFYARQAAHETFETAAHTSWTRRRASHVGMLSSTLLVLPDTEVDEIVSATLGGLDVTTDVELATDCQLRVLSPYRGRMRVVYEYGIDGAPLEVSQAVLKLAALNLRKSSRPENARGESIDGVYTSYVLATGTEGAWTGIASVDAAIAAHGRGRGGVA